MSDPRVADIEFAGRDLPWLRARLAAVFDAATAHVVLLRVDDGLAAPGIDPAVLLRYPLPIVALIEREAVGGLFNLAMGCDIRVAAEDARLGPTGDGSTVAPPVLNALLGHPGGGHQFDQAPPWPARIAFERGLITGLAPPGQAAAEAVRIASVIAARGPLAVRLAKEAVWRGLPMPLEQALRFETDLTLLLQTTKDRAEGVAAFLEKRGPRFTGE